MQIGCCGTTNSYRKIRCMGYDFIELSGRQIMSLPEGEFAAFLRQYREIGFPCYGFNDYCGGDVPIAGPEYHQAAARSYAEKLCERGGRLGIKTIGIGAPAARMLPAGYPAEQADAEITDFLNTICTAASQYKITVLLEAVNKHACNYLNTTKEAYALVRTLHLPNLALVFDLYHANVMGEDIAGVKGMFPYIRHLHISTDLENHRRGFLEEEDIPALMEFLKMAAETGYQGNISVEASEEYLEEHGGRCANYMWHSLACVFGREHSADTFSTF